MTHLELANDIQTPYFNHSRITEFLGKNVRSPSLVKGGLYIQKLWSIKHLNNTDNAHSVVEFLGVGYDINGVIKYYDENPKVKEMKRDDKYYFRGINSKGEVFDFTGREHELCICVNTDPVRVTFYSIVGHEVDEGARAVPAKPAKSVKPAERNTAQFVPAGVRETAPDGSIYPGVDVTGIKQPVYWTTRL